MAVPGKITRKIFTRKVKLYRSDYFPFFRLATLPIRVKIISIFIFVKIALLFLLCDFGPAGYECAEELLRIAFENDGKLPLAKGVGGLCAPLPFSFHYRYIFILIILYIIWDVGIYFTLFISEEWVARDRLGRNVNMNSWREDELFSRKNAKKKKSR